MSRTGTARARERSTRVKLGGSVLALALLENGRQVRARMNQLSINGGLLSLEQPLDEAIKITVLFHVGSTSIRAGAQMLFPMWATKGCLQPFRFLELSDQDRTKLAGELDALVRAGAQEEDE